MLKSMLNILLLASLFATGCEEKAPPLPEPTWPVRPGEFVYVRQFQATDVEVKKLVFSSDGDLLLGHCGDVDKDGDVAVWDAQTGERLLTCTQPTVKQFRLVDVAFLPDGRRFLTAGGESVRLWDANTGELLFEYVFGENPVHAIAPMADGKQIFVGTESGGIYIVDVATGVKREIFRGHSGAYSLALSPDEKLLVSAHSMSVYTDSEYQSVTPSVFLWDLESKQLVREFEAPVAPMRQVAFLSGGECIIGSTFDSNYVWDVSTGELVALAGETSWESPGIWSSIAPSPSRNTFLAGGAGRGADTESTPSFLTLWDWDSESDTAAAWAPEELKGFISAVAFAPDGQHVASADHHGVIRIWRVPDGPYDYDDASEKE